jgi:hypothetical protein
MIIKMRRYSCKGSLLLSDFDGTWIPSTDLKNTQIENFVKIRSVGAELFRADGETDRQTDKHDEANSRYLQFYERAKKKHRGTDC